MTKFGIIRFGRCPAMFFRDNILDHIWAKRRAGIKSLWPVPPLEGNILTGKLHPPIPREDPLRLHAERVLCGSEKWGIFRNGSDGGFSVAVIGDPASSKEGRLGAPSERLRMIKLFQEHSGTRQFYCHNKNSNSWQHAGDTLHSSPFQLMVTP